jgi:ankyrin repeat protein
VKKIREALNNLPKTLDETYERILLSIDQEDRDIVLEALRWLCFSTKVLTVADLAEAAVFSAFVEPPPECAPLKVSFDQDYFFADPLDILGRLSGLVICVPDPDSEVTDAVTVLQDSDGTEHTPESRPKFYTTNFKILLSHFSIKEYLVSGRLGSQVEHFAIDEDGSHQILATNCIYFILFSQESLEYSKTYDERLSNTKRPFFDYATWNWAGHARKAEYDSRLVNLIVLVLTTPHQIRAGFLGFLDFDHRRGRAKDISPLYAAAYGVLYFPCKQLIEKGADIDAQGGKFGSAIQAAVALFRDQSVNESIIESIVKLLLDHGANVNTQGGKYGTALHAASWAGYESIVKLLLDHGANVNAQGGYFSTALQAASIYRHESIVKLLLDHGANVNIQGGPFNTALQAASKGDNQSLVKLLLDHGANVNIRGGIYKTPLKAAVRGGNQIIFQLLLDHGAEVETKAGYYDVDLFGDIYSWRGEIAVVLLEHGAVVSDVRSGVKAEEALERGDFRTFVDIQREYDWEIWNENEKKRRSEELAYKTGEDGE